MGGQQARALALIKSNFVVVALLVVAIGFGLVSDSFLTLDSIKLLINQLPTLMVVTVGMVLVMLVGGIDLSVGSLVALSSTLIASLVVQHGASLPIAMLVGIASGLTFGLLSGWISTYASLPSFIVTLGMLEAGRGLAYLASDQQTVYIGPSIEKLSLPLPGIGASPAFLIALAVVIAGQLLITRTTTGRFLIAIGTRENAAAAIGIRTKPYKLAAFAASGMLAGLGGVLNASYLAAADPNAGSGLELSAIAAAVIGGTSLMGGRGSVFGGFVGVMLIATLQSGLAQVGASEPSKRIMTGVVIVLAVLLDRWRTNSDAK